MTVGAHGHARARAPTLVFWAVSAVGLGAVAALYGVDFVAERARDDGLTRQWEVAGSACPTLSASAYAAARYADKERRTEYDGVVLARQNGHVSCREIADRWGLGFLRHPVCQFTSPGVLRVSTGRRAIVYNPGPGNRATVSVERAAARCVIGGNFTLFHDPT